ncbi:MAG: PAS domain S-box protein, partial [Deltaproteobacteria bacterium]|nr:PAS domain S-box protein [Deltaproteobacteria bacterium]
MFNMTMEQIEERRQEVQRNYEEFFAAARDGFYISTREGEFLDCNDALVKMLGHRVTEEVLVLDLNTDLWMNPWDRTRFQAIIEEQGYVRDYRAVFKRKDGSPLYVTLSSHVWTDRQGNIRGYRGFVVDRTEERKMSAQLQATEIKYRDLFTSIHDGVFSSDSEGAVLDCNRALRDLVGYSKEELLGMNFYRDLFVNADDVMNIRKEFSESGSIRDYEVQVERKDGSVTDVSISGYSTKTPEGAIVAYQWVVRDITEAKRLRKQLIQSERQSAMGKMAAQLAHELNNPIFGIMNCLEMLKDVL